MKNKSHVIDAAMVARKFYCHTCGERLINHPRTRLIERGDPEYKEYSHVGHMRRIGDVELTEYDFQCPSCNRIINPDEQYVIEKMQKMVGKNILTEEEFTQNEAAARLAIERKKKITTIIVTVIFIIATIIALYFAIKTDSFSGKFYL